MAIILKFPSETVRSRGARHAARKPSRSADIIIFPGVRLSRGTPVAAKKKRSSVRRDRLEIAE